LLWGFNELVERKIDEKCLGMFLLKKMVILFIYISNVISLPSFPSANALSNAPSPLLL
jgi:F0F1-type ATP synthase membrane subunit a